MNLWPLRISLRNRNGGENGLNEAVLLAMGALALILPFFLRPDPSLQGTHTQLFLPPCIFFSLTHVPCPFCGATTSFTLLAHGRWLKAFLANPWAPVFALYIVVVSGFHLYSLIRRQTVHLEIRSATKSLLLFFILLWVVKLIVWYGRPWLVKW